MKINGNMQDSLKPMYQTEGGASATAVEEKIDLSTLPDEKLKELMTAPEETVKQMMEGGAQETPEQKVVREKAEADVTASRVNETPEQKTVRETAEATADAGNKDAKLFAGKYKTKEEFVKGFINIAKPLNYNQKLLDAMTSLALKTGDVSALEEVYKDLELAVANNDKAALPGAQQTSATSKPGTPEKSERDTSMQPTKVDNAMRQEATRLTLQGALSELRGSRLAQRMERQGVILPDAFMADEKVTREFLAKLEVEVPWMYDQLENEVTNLVNKHAKEVNEVIHSMQEAEVENPKRRESEIAKIKVEAKTIQLPVKDEEITAFVEEALKQPWLYEERNGIRFIREDAIVGAWYLKNRDTIKKQMQINGEVNGRTQAVTDINDHRKKSTSSISSSSIPSDQGARREKARSIDLKDPKVMDSLSSEEIDALLKDDEKREALRPK